MLSFLDFYFPKHLGTDRLTTMRASMLLGAIALLLCGSGHAASPRPDVYAGQYLATVDIHSQEQAEVLHTLVGDVFGSRAVPGQKARIRGTVDELETLRQKGYAVNVVADDIAKYLQNLELEDEQKVCVPALSLVSAVFFRTASGLWLVAYNRP